MDKGLQTELLTGAAVRVIRHDGHWHLELLIPWEIATKEGYDAEATLEQHRQAKIQFEGDRIKTSVTISNAAFEALLVMGIDLTNAR